MRLFSSALLLCTLACFQGCASKGAASSKPDNFTVSEIALYMSRASMNSVDFEQYKVTPARVFQECGVIRRGRHVPTHQQLFDLTASQRDSLMEQTWVILQEGHEGLSQFEEPGSGDSLFDPGRLKLHIKGNANKFEVKTSVDGVSEPVSQGAQSILELVRNIRSFTKPAACGNPSFYGIGFTR